MGEASGFGTADLAIDLGSWQSSPFAGTRRERQGESFVGAFLIARLGLGELE